MAILIAPCVVATNDLNTRGEEPTPLGIGWLIGAATFVFGWLILTWSMVANPFFENTVRIQTDHGHRVIDTGPYAYIRHPGYIGICALLLSTPPLLASAWTWLPSLLAALALAIRTMLEDRTAVFELKLLEAGPLLLRAFNADYPEVDEEDRGYARVNIGAAMAAIGHRPAIPSILRALAEALETDGYVARCLIGALGDLKAQSAVDAIVATADHPDMMSGRPAGKRSLRLVSPP